MSGVTIEQQLAAVRRRVELLKASGGAPPLRRHVDLLDDVEQRLAQLKARLDVAERSLDADVSGDWATFAKAVKAELESWDVYIERLQTIAATRAWQARERAEEAIGDVRSRRIAVDERLAQVRCSAWQDQREHVGAARDELENKADALSANLHWKE